MSVFFMFIIAYLFGCVNFSIVISKLMLKKDVREYGSGNAGLTNTLRNFGKGAAALVLVGDVLKVVAALLIAWYLLPSQYSIYAAGLGVVLGHNFPAFYGFKGGKGILTTAAIIVFTNPIAGAIIIPIGLIIMFTTRYVSLGSIVICLLFPILMYIMRTFDTSMLVFSLVISTMGIFMHRHNIKRLINGTENRFGGKKNV